MMTTETNLLTPNAITVLEMRYLNRDEEGKIIETPEGLFRRVASHIAKAEALYGKSDIEVQEAENQFYELMTSLAFLPNSPTLMNAGLRLGQLSACFVLPVDDSMEGIFDAVKHAAIIHKSGGGTGFSFSRLRPRGDLVGSTKGVSSGPVTFMQVFDSGAEAVKQGGKRRGANMGMLRVDHPDILEFISCKGDSKKFTNFNISVGLTRAFMDALETDGEYDLFNPKTKAAAGKLRAKEVFDKIVAFAWKNGEPGIVFLDRINENNPTPHIGEIESTNPCGEQPLLPYESCNLGSVNLARMVKDGKVEWQLLKETTWAAVHFLDNVIDVNKYPLKEIEAATKSNRKIGLGVMGWADMLIQLGIPYNSDRAFELAEKVSKCISEESRAASMALAVERGTFPNYAGSTWEKLDMPVRNATVTTIAPTGSLSIIAGCSSGIEPLFAVAFVRNVLEGTKLIEVNPFFEEIIKQSNLYLDDDVIERITDAGSLRGIDGITEDIKRVFVTAYDITPEEHIKMQSIFQKYTDNAVSKTVNLPKTATTKDVETVYMLADKLGCKGVTIYRNGSREDQVLSTKETAEAQFKPVPTIIPKKRPTFVVGGTKLIRTGCGNLYVTINQDEEGKPFEVFTNIGKAGGCASSQAEAIGRLISLTLRSDVEPEEIVQQLKGISCHQPEWNEGGKVLSCSDAIARALDSYQSVRGNGKPMNGGNGNGKTSHNEAMRVGACPECGGIVEHESGCAICHSCGRAEC